MISFLFSMWAFSATVDEKAHPPLSSAEGFSDPSLVSSRTSVANKPVKSNESYVSNNIQKQIVRDQQQKDTEKSTRQTSPASYELIK